MSRTQIKAGDKFKGLAGLVPVLITIFFSILMLLPVGTSATMSIFPHLPMIAVFYWTAHRPLSMPLGAAALVGLILDLWLGVPLGLNILLLVTMRMFVIAQLKYFKGRSVLVYWAIFSLSCMALFAMSWIIASYATSSFATVGPLFNQALVTIVAYPIVSWILTRARAAWT